jgi:hypothetical protein
MGPKTRNDCDGEDQQQFTGLVWRGRRSTTLCLFGLCTSADLRDTVKYGRQSRGARTQEFL